jgi:rubrerythrin
MSIICSFMGHDWGETQTETEYDEGTDEIAVTEREFRICDRCDERRIVSENTEVRAKSDTAEKSEQEPNEPGETEPTESASVKGDTTQKTGTETEEDERVEPNTSSTKSDDQRHDATVIQDNEPGKDDSTESMTQKTEAVDADYRCPECGFVSSDPSLREGDMCPNCGTGYIQEA